MEFKGTDGTLTGNLGEMKTKVEKILYHFWLALLIGKLTKRMNTN